MSLEKRYSIAPDVLAASQKDNVRFSQYVIYIFVGIAGGLIIYNLVLTSIRHIRTLACLNNETQAFFKSPQPLFAKIKQHLISAPLFAHRHSRQMRIGQFAAGILPTRFQSVLFLGILVMNVILAIHGMEWDGVQTTLILHLRNRVGLLAVTNMIPLVFIAGRNNPLISWTRISFDTWNLVHRWLGHIVIALAIAHSACELYYFDILAKQMHKPSLAAFNEFMKKRFLLYGFITFVAMMCIFLTTFTAFRLAFYETFLHIHIALVALILAALWIHLDDLPPQTLVKIIIAIWVVERLIRLLTLTYRNLGRSGTQATIETLPGDALCMTLRPARPWAFKPGQHIYLTLPTVGLWTSHPFSVAWSTSTPRFIDPEKSLPIHDPSLVLSSPQTSVSLIIRRRAGFTENLYQKTLKSPDGRINLPALVEGPYGGTHTLQSYGTVMLFAGGVGITHSLPFIRDLIAGYAAGTVATRRVLLVWVVRSSEHLEWIRLWMSSILSMHKRRDILRIQIFVTRASSAEEIHSPSATVQMFPGKPDVESLVEMESRDQVGAMGVAVCGPGGLGDDVRAAVRRRVGEREVDFLEEGFGW